MTESQTLQLLWAANTVLLVILGFFIRMWINGVKEKEYKNEKMLDNKIDKVTCLERHEDLKKDVSALFRHKHPLYKDRDQTGEVIIP